MYHCLQGFNSETDGSVLFEATGFQSIHSFEIFFLASSRIIGRWEGLSEQDYRDTEYQGYVNPKLYKRTDGNVKEVDDKSTWL